MHIQRRALLLSGTSTNEDARGSSPPQAKEEPGRDGWPALDQSSSASILPTVYVNPPERRGATGVMCESTASYQRIDLFRRVYEDAHFAPP